ncbi:hypothetical protein C5167_000963 [Papaver somniferum]|uniref:RNA helicase n=1 Tax=Papaver somniferum TaxID=3469 RepID=A0A4Y7KX92_PAPSO|nr:ATP-dependent RNA helicase DEAH13-like [Papaver somniferum]RZC76808.1 hypothetical protein C5167_000963 [Papaver somniferum]
MAAAASLKNSMFNFEDKANLLGDQENPHQFGCLLYPRTTRREISANAAKKTPLSKSQKRKLRKLEEEKAQEAKLSESVRILEKYKIQHEAFFLLKSSGNIGQAETVKEKRLRAVQCLKAGLKAPQDDRPSKRRAKESEPSQVEVGVDEKQDVVPPMIVEHERRVNAPLASCTSQKPPSCSAQCTDIGYDNALPTKDNGGHMEKEHKYPSTKASEKDEKSNTSSQVKEEVTASKVGANTDSTVSDGNVSSALMTPIFVPVSRPSEVERKRKDLPIVMMEQEIMEAIKESSVIILCGETGCGKTTQVPQFLYEAGFGSSKSGLQKGIIGVTQPRRVAVLATAKRVAYELGLTLGKEVGFQVRHDRRLGNNASIKFMTDGILLREVQNDLLLKRYSVIILDEVHERSLNTDVLIGMLSLSLIARQKLYHTQQKLLSLGTIISPENMVSELKVILMSATLRVEDFVSGKKLFPQPPPVVEVPTRQYPVTIHFSKRTDVVDYIGQAFKKVMSIHKRLPPGGILVFVTGQREVEYLCKKLCGASNELKNRNKFKCKTDEKPAKSLGASSIDEKGIDMKDISEACEIQGDSHYRILNDEEEEDDSYSSGTESDISYNSEDEFASTSDKDGDHANGLEGESLTSLKAAFEALATKKAHNPDLGEQLSLPNSDELGNDNPLADGVSKSSPTSGKKHGDTQGFCPGGLCVLPLYAMLPAAAQLRVFEEVEEGQRLVVVATNVAETSLTIPGIKYVVDTGREKVKNYNFANGMETYEVQWISKASAAQRAGRAGRTGPGHSYRLYSSAVFCNILSDFSVAEISKSPVDGIVLLLKSMGVDRVAEFPFPTPPKDTALVEAERCLKALEALDSSGGITPLGKAMSHYPMSPRHSRMLLTVIQIMRKVKNHDRANLVLGYAVAAAAALSLSNPLMMQLNGVHEDDVSATNNLKKDLDKQDKMKQKQLKQAAKDARAKFCNPSSDALTIAYALQLFELAQNPYEFCKENALHLKTMEEMSKLRKQLLKLVFHQVSVDESPQEFLWSHGTVQDVELAWRVSSDKHPLLQSEEEHLGQAICAGWADRVAKRVKVVSKSSELDGKGNAVRYQAAMVNEPVFLHRWSTVAASSPELLVYNELIQTKRPNMHGVTSVKPDWLVKYASSQCTFSAPLTDRGLSYQPLTDEVLCQVTPYFGPHLWQLWPHNSPIKNDALRVSVFACALLGGHVLPCLGGHVQKFLAAQPAIVLKPEAYGQKRVGNLLNRLKGTTRSIDSRARLRETWNKDTNALYSEILDWFQEKHLDKFEEVWKEMHREVQLEYEDLFPKSGKSRKNGEKERKRLRIG